MKHEVVFYTYPKFLFAWPMIILGLLFYPLADRINNETLAWIYGLSIIVVVFTMGFDLNRNFTVFWLVLLAACGIAILWLRDVKSVTIFSRIYQFMADLDPVYCKTLGLFISIVLGILYVIMWVWTRINCKWRITHNEFEHYQFGQKDDSIARGAKRIASSYPDLFEFLLCLAGDLVIYDASSRQELRRISDVPLLPWVKRKINRLMESTAVVSSVLEDESESGK